VASFDHARKFCFCKEKADGDLTKQSHVSFHLLQKLKESNDDPFWDDQPHLLVWMLHMGGSFSPRGTARSDYKELVRSNQASRFEGLYSSLEDLLVILDQFIWSDKAYRAQVEDFWAELRTAPIEGDDAPEA
jgi:hypothetical protein